jgi:hypothetical protein
MEQRQQEDRVSAEGMDLRPAADLGDARRIAGQELGREVAERGHDTRLDQADLLEQIRPAGLDLHRLRIAVARRAALEDVGDEDVPTRHADSGQQLCQQRSGAADERKPLSILLGSRRLADEHQIGVGVACSEDDIRPSRRERAAVAGRRLVVDLDQLFAAPFPRRAQPALLSQTRIGNPKSMVVRSRMPIGGPISAKCGRRRTS